MRGRWRLRAVSIHAPVRERRSEASLSFVACDVSIHAPVRERPAAVVSDVPYGMFLSTPP